jgi:hypothetical protein
MYIKTNHIENASHWIPKHLNPLCEGFLTVGKPYRLHYSEQTDEIVFTDDLGMTSSWYQCVPGDYVRETKNNVCRCL